MNRRDAFRGAIATAVASVVPLGNCSEPIASCMPIHFESEPICLACLRDGGSVASSGVLNKIQRLCRNLPNDGRKYYLKWLNVLDSQTNPHKTTGKFIAIQAAESQRSRFGVDYEGFICDMERFR